MNVAGGSWFVRGLLLIGVTLLCIPRAGAHHAFASTYLPHKVVTIEGRVIEFLFRNPHSVVLVATPVEKGETITWAAEWGGAGQLSRQGIDQLTINSGDYLIITGNPSRNSADRRLRIESLRRPADGWNWNGGN